MQRPPGGKGNRGRNSMNCDLLYVPNERNNYARVNEARAPLYNSTLIYGFGTSSEKHLGKHCTNVGFLDSAPTSKLYVFWYFCFCPTLQFLQLPNKFLYSMLQYNFFARTTKIWLQNLNFLAFLGSVLSFHIDCREILKFYRRRIFSKCGFSQPFLRVFIVT